MQTCVYNIKYPGFVWILQLSDLFPNYKNTLSPTNRGSLLTFKQSVAKLNQLNKEFMLGG